MLVNFGMAIRHRGRDTKLAFGDTQNSGERLGPETKINRLPVYKLYLTTAGMNEITKGLNVTKRSHE